jgi:hypothetical protein
MDKIIESYQNLAIIEADGVYQVRVGREVDLESENLGNMWEHYRHLVKDRQKRVAQDMADDMIQPILLYERLDDDLSGGGWPPYIYALSQLESFERGQWRYVETIWPTETEESND